MTSSRTLAAVALLGALAPSALPCTTFCFRSGSSVLYGKNYDWDIGDGMLVVNKRGVSKSSMSSVNPARWVSKYGSVTFNQYGREFPSGGINEAGLVVELMALAATRYPTETAKPGLGCLDWIQYQLDTAATVAEALENAGRLRIEPQKGLHYLVCDPTGECASMEYLDGRLVFHSGPALPIAALTNDTYADSLAYAQRFQGFGGSLPMPSGIASLDRFVRAATFAAQLSRSAAAAGTDDVFWVLDAVAQGEYTQWSIVYDLSAREVAFRTRERREIRRVRLADLDFDCSRPVRVLDLRAALEGDVGPLFVEYSREANLDLVVRAFRGTPFLADTPDSTLQAVASHPDTMSCGAGSLSRRSDE